uniref:Titin n=1 Tax=Sinocyclocheilus rhinocerous TaxID=307959 RepID=A0A673JL27_9TELE
MLKISTFFLFNFTEPPKFTRKPEKVTVVKPGQLVVFECQITGTPEIDTYWFRDGNEISPSDKHKMTFVDSLARLEISSSDIKDCGVYYCEARNEAGSESCSMELRVKVLVKPLSPLEVVNGSNAYFECQVKGTAPFEVTWQKDSKDIKSSLKHVILQKNGSIMTLDVQKCDALDVGEYQCIHSVRLIDFIFMILSLFILFNISHYLSEPPSFVERIENVVTVLGKKVEFKCVVRGSPPLSIQWQKDENWILEDPSIERTFLNSIDDNSVSLEIECLEKADTGTYTCKLTNKAGSCECSGTLRVKGQIITFAENTCTLKVPTLKLSDSGTYKCKAVNSAGTAETFASLVVKATVSILGLHHTGIYILTVSNSAGSKTVSLNVTVLDVPAAPIGPVNILEVTPDSMVIEWRPPKDDGGSPVMNYIVEKRESNKETWGGVIASDISEDALTLGWTMPLFDGGSPISGYIIERRHKGGKWIRVNKTPCKDLRYRVLGLFEDNEYEFRVFAENVAGFSGPSPISDPAKPCRPITVPGPPVNPKVKDYSCTYADLVWIRPTRDGGSPVLGYIVEYQKAGAEWEKVNKDDLIKQCAYRVKGLTEGTEYRFRVKAVNMIGEGETREIPESVIAKDIVIPPEIEVDATCRDCLTVRVGHNINVVAYVKARPDPEITWSKGESVFEKDKRTTLTNNFPVVQMRIKEATRADHGKYTLKAVNEAGEASATITVNVLDRPGHCQNLKLTYVTKNSFGMGRPANLKDAVSPKEIHGKHLF